MYLAFIDNNTTLTNLLEYPLITSKLVIKTKIEVYFEVS